MITELGERSCGQCGKDLLPPIDARRRFCSQPCRAVASRARWGGQCSVTDCEERIYTRKSGLCAMHYHRQVRGSADMRVARIHRAENVHHKNGQRADNRPENLELWIKPQPAGQRLVDLLDFVVAEYRTEIQQRLDEERP